MDLERYTDNQILVSVEAELAKSTGELRCALGDIDKALTRIRFCIAAIHEIKQRQDQKE